MGQKFFQADHGVAAGEVGGDVVRVGDADVRCGVSGDVGDGIGVGGTGSILVDKYITVTGGESFFIQKQGWMFEKDVANDPSGLWRNGRMTWVVAVDAKLKQNFDLHMQQKIQF